MKILYVCKTSLLAQGGGGEERADEITKGLVDEGHEVTILSGKTAPDLPKRSLNNGREIRHVKCAPDFLFRNPTQAFFVTRYLFAFASIPIVLMTLMDDDIDIIIENMTPYPTFTVVFAKLFHTPIIAVQHEFFDRSCYEVYDIITASILLLVQNFLRIFSYQAIIVPTSHVKEKFVEYGIDEAQIDIIPNGVDFQRYNRPDIPFEKGHLIVVGRLTKRKGQHHLIRVVRILQDRGANVHLHIVGKGPQKKSLEETATNLNIRRSVTFHGFVEEERKIELLNKSEMFLFASKQEGFGIVLLEAMAAGCPIVARWLPVYEDFFSNEKNGYLVKGGNEKEFVDKIAHILNDDDERSSQKMNNIQTAEEFSWKRAAQRTEAILQEINQR